MTKPDTYTANFSMQGFERSDVLSGEPAPTVGFSFPSMAMLHDPKKSNISLSVYFRLMSYDGRVAHYVFYNWRQMGVES